MQPNVNLDQTQPVKCEECNEVYFEQVLHLRKASGFLTGTGQDTYIPIPVFACRKCGHINSEFQPKRGVKLEDS
jgi:uncharacterized Zn finger protein